MDYHNNHQHPFDHTEDERKRAPSYVTEEKSVEEASTRGAKGTEKLGLDDVETAHVRIQHVEHDKSSSCSSSSDDESQAFQKKSKEEAYNHGSEETSYGNEDKLVSVMCEEVPKVAENGTHGNVNGKSGMVISANKSVSNGISKVELEGNEGKVFPSTSTPPAETSRAVEKTQDSEAHDHFQKQLLVASTPPIVQRTSFFSYWGLFDVLTISK